MNVKRLRQVLKYGWLHANEITCREKKDFLFTLKVFFDIIACFSKYKMWSNQYVKESFYSLNKDARVVIGNKYKDEGIKRDEWQKDFVENRKFLIKYSNVKYELSPLREVRNRAYTKRFNAGENLFVEYDVNISRQHYLDGNISIGNNVLLAKHVFIDYSGGVTIGDNVSISDGVKIETHNHAHYTHPKKKDVIKKPLLVEESVLIGTGSIILESCNKIGRNARIGAGAVVRNDIPPYAIVIGNPAIIVGFTLTPNELKLYEEDYYPFENRMSVELYTKSYNKYFLSRAKDIVKLLKN